MATTLAGKVAIVTGASRGVGKGVALGLAEAGATIYVTARTVEEGKAAVALPGTIHQTVREIEQLGGPGRGIAVACDHRDDSQTRALFDRVIGEQQRIDILVNNAWGGYEYYNDGTQFWTEKGFWTQPMSRWDNAFATGVRAHYLCSVLAAPHMIERKSGLIVNVSALAALSAAGGAWYSVSKHADAHMATCMAHELKPHNVAVIALFPGLVRTEAVMKAAAHFDMSNSESPTLQGRVVAALAADPYVINKTGRWLLTAEVAEGYGISDVDGKRPRSLRSETPATPFVSTAFDPAP
jgi:NAD(P)-dependent dehydrogenase (short-subunit alcohol dehydrogenase family)